VPNGCGKNVLFPRFALTSSQIRAGIGVKRAGDCGYELRRLAAIMMSFSPAVLEGVRRTLALPGR
jgi:hypothetical protein